MGQLSALAVIAADQIVVPLPTNSKGLDGLDTVFAMVKEYRQAAQNLSISFCILTQHDARTKHDIESLASIRTQLPLVAPISSPLNSRPAPYKDAQLTGMPIPVFQPGGDADLEIRQVVSEFLEAIQVSVGVGSQDV